MELNELIRQVLLQMFQSSLQNKADLEKVDNNVLYYIGKERESDEQGTACRNSGGGTIG